LIFIFGVGIIEIRKLTNTSASRNAAEMLAEKCSDAHDRISILLIYDFPEQCDTAIDANKRSESLRGLNEFEDEEEVLLIPGTFFEVTSVEK
jgi:hypothetical protein